jgi:hypothetical protein
MQVILKALEIWTTKLVLNLAAASGEKAGWREQSHAQAELCLRNHLLSQCGDFKLP